MAISKDQRNYNMLDADLCMFTSDLCNTMTRDLSDLVIFGVSTLNISTLEGLGNAFEILPPDEVYLGELMVATDAKNVLADQVRETIRTMALRAEVKWGTSSGQYMSLKVMGMNQFTDNMLLLAARNMHVQMTAFLTDLAPLGLTQTMLDDFETLNESFETAMNDMTNKIMVRDVKSKERVEKGNEIYDWVGRYCEFGKRLYAMTDPAKYNDYVIYGSGGGGGPVAAPVNFTYSQPGHYFDWSDVENATSYQLEKSDDGIAFTEIYAGVDSRFNYTPPENGPKSYRVRARNSGGFGPYSEVIVVAHYDHLDAPANFQAVLQGSPPNYDIYITWDAVDGAEWYNFYHSVVNIGQPVGDWMLFSQPTVNYFHDPGVQGKRFYFYVKAGNPQLVSDASIILIMDVPV